MQTYTLTTVATRERKFKKTLRTRQQEKRTFDNARPHSTRNMEEKILDLGFTDTFYSTVHQTLHQVIPIFSILYKMFWMINSGWICGKHREREINWILSWRNQASW